MTDFSRSLNYQLLSQPLDKANTGAFGPNQSSANPSTPQDVVNDVYTSGLLTFAEVTLAPGDTLTIHVTFTDQFVTMLTRGFTGDSGHPSGFMGQTVFDTNATAHFSFEPGIILSGTLQSQLANLSVSIVDLDLLPDSAPEGQGFQASLLVNAQNGPLEPVGPTGNQLLAGFNDPNKFEYAFLPDLLDGNLPLKFNGFTITATVPAGSVPVTLDTLNFSLASAQLDIAGAKHVPPTPQGDLVLSVNKIVQGFADGESTLDFYSFLTIGESTARFPGEPDSYIEQQTITNPGWSVKHSEGLLETIVPFQIELRDWDTFITGANDWVDISPDDADLHDPKLETVLRGHIDLNTREVFVRGRGGVEQVIGKIGEPLTVKGSSSGEGQDYWGGWANLTFTIENLGTISQPLQVSNGTLSILGEARDDNIVIDPTGAGGIRVTLNGAVTEYAPGQISTVLINAGLGNNTVTVNTPVTLTVQSSGNDKLVLGPALQGATYTPDASGLPGYGTISAGGKQIQLENVELVQGIAPVINSVSMSAATIDEDGVTTLTGAFTDPGSAATHTVTIDWGDGSQSTVLNLAGQRTFATTHRFLDDNPTGTSSDLNNIRVTVTDNDNLSASGNASITVDNVAPVLTSFGSNSPSSNLVKEGQPVTLLGAFTDVGTRDVHTAVLDWGDGTTTTAAVTEANGSGSFLGTRAYTSGGIYNVSSSLTDDDLGGATGATQVYITGVGVHMVNGVKTLQVIGTNSADVVSIDLVGPRNGDNGQVHEQSLVVTASFLDEGQRIVPLDDIQQIQVVTLDGNDTVLLEEKVSLAAFLDGGSGDDQMQGGNSPVTFISGPGNDTYAGKHGANTVDYSGETGAVFANLTTGVATGASIGTDKLINIQNVIGSNNGSELTGDAHANVLTIGANDRNVDAKNGDDTIVIEQSSVVRSHVINGGGGSDTLDLSAATQSVVVDLAAGTANGGQIGSSTLIDIENVVGSTFNDIIAGDGRSNALRGNTGNDTITLGAGNDTFYFKDGDGSDTINDFVAGRSDDKIDLTSAGTGYESFAEMLATPGAILQSGADTLLSLDPGGGAGDSILLRNVTAASLTAADFVF